MQFIALHNDMQPTGAQWPAMKAHNDINNREDGSVLVPARAVYQQDRGALSDKDCTDQKWEPLLFLIT